uniref:Chaperonin containing TCP1 subunit 3 n=1 Tax=Otus sunia TaxID=257818 RepID=A0A8C8AYL1_9STRI
PQFPQPLLVQHNMKRESGRKVQTGNITAAKTIADIIRTCLGPRAMMKMLLDPMGGIVMTNDGNAILREIQVQHPAAKSMIEISRTQDEEVGDGTTSVIILAGEMLSVAEHFLEQQMHPTVIIGAYRKALDDMISILKKIGTSVDVNNKEMMLKIIKSAINTKAINRWSDLACSIALDAVKTVEFEENGRKEIDIKKYAKVEKVSVSRAISYLRTWGVGNEPAVCPGGARRPVAAWLVPALAWPAGTGEGSDPWARHWGGRPSMSGVSFGPLTPKRPLNDSSVSREGQRSWCRVWSPGLMGSG